MNPDLRERLRRLGVHKGAAHLKPSRPALQPDRTGTPARAQLEPLRTPFGYAHVSRSAYALAHRHGDRTLDAALRYPPESLARLVAGRGVAEVDLRRALFLDTETTGLNGGAGTFAFLVGLGYFDDERFVVEQFFLRDPAEEAAMLCEVDRRVNDRQLIVTFNGQAFDVPLLESRFVLSRIASPFAGKHHLDLLLPARRVWRGSLDSCSLGSLEFHLLGVRREQRDVPGAVIPFLYREYLAAGGGNLNEDMQRVMYHNLNDVLSMVALVSRLADALTRPQDAAEHFNAARFYERVGDYDAAERSYRAAAAGLPLSSLRHVARFMRRRGHLEEALAIWQRLAELDDVEGLIEVAKHYEWRACDLDRALDYARRALRVSASPTLRAAIAHRIARLERKVRRA
ncbi:MAG: ribonuclease H-like domain-containing protein [Anaerolineae bacterium]|nr:ribonuclease H-like domain-containing protein [Candidatus Roseilinea sp.]MDW8450667.1 ribonuclease H-like domain-containing protein [Anaerolineae bacterium]